MPQIADVISKVKPFFRLSHAEKEKFAKPVQGNVGWNDVGRENLNQNAESVTGADYKETYNFQPTMDFKVGLVSQGQRSFLISLDLKVLVTHSTSGKRTSSIVPSSC